LFDFFTFLGGGDMSSISKSAKLFFFFFFFFFFQFQFINFSIFQRIEEGLWENCLGQARSVSGVIMSLRQAAQAATKSDLNNLFKCDVDAGLTYTEVSRRQKMHGFNRLEAEEESMPSKFLEQFKDPMIGLLCVSAVVSLAVGQWDDAISIMLAVFIVLVVAFVQEWRSEKSLALLNNLVPHQTTCLREGQLREVSAEQLVPGDVVVLNPGNRVPADLRLIEAINLEVDESSLTGESELVPKTDQVVMNLNDDPPLEELKNIVFMGTLVRAGRARGIVVHVGVKTQFGKIFLLMQDQEKKRTPLQKSMDDLGATLSYASVGFIALIVLVGWFRGFALLEMFTLGVSLAVAAIPEGLPICTTVTLALGVIRMASKNAIIRRLPAVEVLGCTTILCVDKTGTITTNEMKVRAVVLPLISSKEETKKLTTLDHLNSLNEMQLELLNVGRICSNAKISRAKGSNTENDTNQFLNGSIDSSIGEVDIIGSPTETAIVRAAHDAGVSFYTGIKRIHEIPFSSKDKWMGVQIIDTQRTNGNITTFAKGAVEHIIMRCSHVNDRGIQRRTMLIQDRNVIIQQSEKMEKDGLRVLACACSKTISDIDGTDGVTSDKGVYNNLTFIGLIGISDPPRKGSKPTIDQLKKYGVQTIMMTGDAKGTALSIAREVGILEDVDDSEDSEKKMSGVVAELGIVTPSCSSMSGSDLDALADGGKSNEEIIRCCRVFYRMEPRHKQVVVAALQKNKEVVAMTGDGVNDAPGIVNINF
jgi:P-type Ca2+ transporter type 2C